MASFPKLKTGAVVQYPATKSIRFSTECLRFMDGAEQRYRDAGTALCRWDIQLNHLDESEMAELELFFETAQGRFGVFEFIDPWDGSAHPNCSLESDELDFVFSGEMDGAMKLTIVEHRS